MSLVSHDSIWKYHYGVTNEPKNVTLEKNNARNTVLEEETTARRLGAGRKINNNELTGRINLNNYDIVTYRNNAKNHKLKTCKNNTNKGHLLDRHKTDKNEIKSLTDNIFHLEENTVDVASRRRNNKNANSVKYKNNTGDKEWNNICNNEKITLNNVVIKKEDVECVKINVKQVFSKNDIGNSNKSRASDLNKVTDPKKIWQKHNDHKFSIKNRASNALRRIYEKYKRKSRWRINSGVLISLMMLNVAGLSSADDTSTFTSSKNNKKSKVFWESVFNDVNEREKVK